MLREKKWSIFMTVALATALVLFSLLIVAESTDSGLSAGYQELTAPTRAGPIYANSIAIHTFPTYSGTVISLSDTLPNTLVIQPQGLTEPSVSHLMVLDAGFVAF